MNPTPSDSREVRALKLLKQIQEDYFSTLHHEGYTLYDKKMNPLEFYGKIYKKELFWRRSSFVRWIYLPHVKETRFLEIRLTGPTTFSGFTMKFSELVKAETSSKINDFFILHKFWVNCSFQHR